MSSKPLPGRVFTPFLRRFTDERANDIAALRQLHSDVTRRLHRSIWSDPDTPLRLAADIVDDLTTAVAVPPRLADALEACLEDLLALESPLFREAPVHDWSTLTLKDQVDLRRYLRAQEHFLSHADRIIDQLRQSLAAIAHGIAMALPEMADDDSPFEVPLLALIDVPDIVDRLIGTVTAPALAEAGLFATLADRLYRNTCEASKVVPYEEHRRPLITAGDSRLDPSDLVATYLKDTPFQSLFNVPVPFVIPQHVRFEHMHILAAPGHGKTQTLQHMIAADLTADNPPSLVIIDNKGDIFRILERLALFDPNGGRLAERLIIVDPTDIAHPPAINLFDINRARLAGCDQRHREQIENGTIELYDYIFGSLLDAEMTSKQALPFRHAARLMLTIPDATLMDMVGLFDDPGAYWHYVEALPDGATKRFFERDFRAPAYAGTKVQIVRRLESILEQPSFERIFSQPRNRIDMADAINSGKIVVVHTAKDFLKWERASFFGRVFIALTLQAALERAPIPIQNRRPAFLYIDEAHEYFDRNIDELLTQARSYRLGIGLAHQYLDQLGSRGGLKASMAAVPAIKLAGGVSDKDARALAPDMRCSPEFIAAQASTREASTFAAYVRGVTPAALSLSIPRGTLERMPTMSEAAYAQMRAANRARYTANLERTAPPSDRALVPEPATLRPGKINVGEIETVTLPDYGVVLDAFLDTGAELSMLHVADLSLDPKGRQARFTLLARGGARLVVERPVERIANVSGYGAGRHPVVRLSVRLGPHTADEAFSLVTLSAEQPVLLGKPFLAGRVRVDNEHDHTVDTDDGW